MSKKIVGVFVGSLRKESFSKKIAQFVCGLMSKDFEAKIVEIGNLPLYNQDFDDENKVPKEWEIFRNQVKQMQGFLFVTPEYNRSVPAVLKNAIDVGSRPYGYSVWDAKPGAIISVSTGRISGFGANHHLRQSLVFTNIYAMQQPEAYVGDVESVLDEKGDITDERTKGVLQNFVDECAKWMNKF